MLSDTLAEGLEHYAIGPKIRTLRQRKKLSLVQLGAHTGLSPAMLSKIECGHVFPTLPTLLRIALVFGVGLEHFFSEGADRRVAAIVRARDRVRLPDRPGQEEPAYFFESLDFPVNDRELEGYHAEFPAGAGPSEPHTHDGAELVYVLKRQARHHHRRRGAYAQCIRLHLFRPICATQLPLRRAHGRRRRRCGDRLGSNFPVQLTSAVRPVSPQ